MLRNFGIFVMPALACHDVCVQLVICVSVNINTSFHPDILVRYSQTIRDTAFTTDIRILQTLCFDIERLFMTLTFIGYVDSPTLSFYSLLKDSNIRIWYIRTFNGHEVRIENSITRVTVRHHKTCRVMLNSYPE